MVGVLIAGAICWIFIDANKKIVSGYEVSAG
jgi:hypothetical protein